MRLTIRVKLTALLIIAGVLPLIAALIAVTLEGGRLRRSSVGSQFLSVAGSRAATMTGILRHELDEIASLTREDQWIAAAATADSLALSTDRAEMIDAQWPQLADDAEPIHTVLTHPLAAAMSRFQRTRQNCREIFLTDRLGRVVAASNRTTDFLQADEAWWQNAWADGHGRAYVSPVEYDQSTAGWSIDICLPLRQADGTVVGVCKVVLDLAGWVSQAAPFAGQADHPPLLLQADGTILYGRGLAPYAQTLDEWTPPAADGPTVGRWLLAGDMLRAYAPVDLGDTVGNLTLQAPRWFVVVQTPTHQALAAVRQLGLVILIAGGILIVGAFAVGQWLANRVIVAPLARLRTATARVAAGDFSHRVLEEGLASATHDELGQLAGDFDHMITAVERSHAALEAANELKSRFIRVAGHELRTPLAYILGMTDLLARQTDDQKVHRSLDTLKEKAQRLDDVINNMLTLADTQQRAAALDLSQFDVADLVAAVTDELRPFATQREQQIQIAPAAESHQILADRLKLHDALANLVSNAIKFTPDGGVITLSAQAKAGGHVAIAVRDQGEGIDHADFAHIFQPFWGGRDVLKHSSGQFGYCKRGAGFGLAIARQFVRMHGGDIQVVSSPDGSEFSIVMPARPLGYDASDESLGASADT